MGREHETVMIAGPRGYIHELLRVLQRLVPMSILIRENIIIASNQFLIVLKALIISKLLYFNPPPSPQGSCCLVLSCGRISDCCPKLWPDSYQVFPWSMV